MKASTKVWRAVRDIEGLFDDICSCAGGNLTIHVVADPHKRVMIRAITVDGSVHVGEGATLHEAFDAMRVSNEAAVQAEKDRRIIVP